MARREYTAEQKARRAIYMKSWSEKNKDKISADSAARYKRIKPTGRIAKYARKRLYGVSDEEYQGMIAAQNGKCAACNRDHDPSKKMGALHVDHDHSTGKVRGLLCRSCNAALGYLGDNPEEAADKMYRYAVKVCPERMAA